MSVCIICKQPAPAAIAAAPPTASTAAASIARSVEREWKSHRRSATGVLPASISVQWCAGFGQPWTHDEEQRIGSAIREFPLAASHASIARYLRDTKALQDRSDIAILNKLKRAKPLQPSSAARPPSPSLATQPQAPLQQQQQQPHDDATVLEYKPTDAAALDCDIFHNNHCKGYPDQPQSHNQSSASRTRACQTASSTLTWRIR